MLSDTTNSTSPQAAVAHDVYTRSRFSLLAEAPWRTSMTAADSARTRARLRGAAARGFAYAKGEDLTKYYIEHGAMWVHQPKLDLEAIKKAAMSKINLAMSLMTSRALPESSELLAYQSGQFMAYKAAILSGLTNHAEFLKQEDRTEEVDDFLDDPAVVDFDFIVPGISVRYWDELAAQGIDPEVKLSLQVSPEKIYEIVSKVVMDLAGDLHHMAAQLGDASLLNDVARCRTLKATVRSSLENSVA